MKTIREINLNIKNEPGQLSAISEILGANGINILAFYVSASGKAGNLRFVANDPDRALNVLKPAGFKTNVSEAIACVVPHHPGGLNAVLKPLKAAKINVDFIYPCIGSGDSTILILGVKSLEDTLKIMEDNWIKVLGEELYNI
ncbi:ACT domain-containing protein [Thermodesulfobacteriota bacterium]